MSMSIVLKKISDVFAFIFKYFFISLVFISLFACTHKHQTIIGKVVDESGTGLSNVSVKACYSGWGRSSAGYIVWDKSYCSNPVLTNEKGEFLIKYKGPDSLRLRAEKKGWVHIKGFHAFDSRIVLIDESTHAARNRAKQELRESRFRKWSPGESRQDYFCRVILSSSHEINLEYLGETLQITPVALQSEGPGIVLMSVNGPGKKIESLINEAVLRISGQAVDADFSINPGGNGCKPNTHFLVAELSGSLLQADKKPEIHVPSVRAAFEIHLWDSSSQ